MQDQKNKLLITAEKYLGLHEEVGKDKNNEIITSWLKICLPNKYLSAGKYDETSWCAAFIHGVIIETFGWTFHNDHVKSLGANSLAKSFKNLARSEKWKIITDHNFLQKGDIVVSDRGKHSWQGHIYFYLSHQNFNVHVMNGIGGNQNNEVCISDQLISKFEIGIRLV